MRWGVGDKWLTTDNSVESVDVIGGVVDCALESIGIDQAVRSVNSVTMTGLFLALHITGMWVVDGVGVVVLWLRVVVQMFSMNSLNQRLLMVHR